MLTLSQTLSELIRELTILLQGGGKDMPLQHIYRTSCSSLKEIATIAKK
jgi:hypothetical protein